MIRSAGATAREAKIAELKRLITAGHYETLEKLEEAVDAFLWREEDQRESSDAVSESDARSPEPNDEIRRSHPK